MNPLPESQLVVGVGWKRPTSKPEPVLCLYAGDDVQACQEALLAAIDSGAIFYGRIIRGIHQFAALSKINRPAPRTPVLPPSGGR